MLEGGAADVALEVDLEEVKGNICINYYPSACARRRYEIITIPRDLCACQCVSLWVCPSYSLCVETQKSWDPQGIPSSNSVVSIADHGHICFIWGSQGITLKNRC